ncbi:hypothetical protein [Fulvivirga lutimaris]|uniref:hypothetical protein n=1 Tax=Fulvivirga lutimaris TaxID=1819566 RepID=UPI0012BC65B5|nr:hypothetical protein [Fulvivirga lutimaris]MTI41307.1 hypothetical protein [Fulvivirga lutimaris]
MSLFDRIWRSNFLIRFRSWEYWPFLAVYWPVFIYWLWLSLRARSLFYFTASNPGIENGGMLGESKIKILDEIDDSLIPKTIYIKKDAPIKEVALQVQESFKKYPIICKPDVGERGWKVEKIKSDKELEVYNQNIAVDYIIQEFLTEPMEMGVFYYRYPSESKGIVSSVVIKEMLTLVGNGKSSIEELILANDRAKLQWNTLKVRYQNQLNNILEQDQKMELVAIGNHSRGTKFLSGNHLINQKLIDAFDQISKQLKGFYFGRFDIKVQSVDDLYDGKIKIMELNGAGSEPAHIYHPGSSLWSAYKAIFHHWKVLFKISVANHKLGVPYLSFKEGLATYKKISSEGKL